MQNEARICEIYQDLSRKEKYSIWMHVSRQLQTRSNKWCANHYSKVYKRANFATRMTRQAKAELEAFVERVLTEQPNADEDVVMQQAKGAYCTVGFFPDDVYVVVHRRFGQLKQGGSNENLTRGEVARLEALVGGNGARSG